MVLVSRGDNGRIGGPAPGQRNLISGNKGSGIHLDGGDFGGNLVQNNYIGTDFSGTIPIGNGFNNGDINGDGIAGDFIGDGILVTGPNNTIGGPEPFDPNNVSHTARNLISANANEGIQIIHNSNTVQGNYIGTDVNGEVDGNAGSDPNLVQGMGNIGQGISIVAGFNNNIGNEFIRDPSGNNEGKVIPPYGNPGNVIAGNGEDGVFVLADVDDDGMGNPTITLNGYGNAILGNSIHSNAPIGANPDPDKINSSLAIDLWPFPEPTDVPLVGYGLNPNDLQNDDDHGGNLLQNFPVLNSSQDSTTPGNILINIDFHSDASTAGVSTDVGAQQPGSDFLIEFFANSDCDDSGHGELQRYIGNTTITTLADGTFSNNVDIQSRVDVLLGAYITATATDIEGNTSEPSECIFHTGSPVDVTGLLRNGNPSSTTTTQSDITISWSAPRGLQVIVQFAPDLTTWVNISPIITMPAEGMDDYTHPGGAGNPASFYRVVTP